MASEQVRPIRAWAEFDKWSVFVWFADEKWGFSYHPKNGANGPANHWGVESLTDAVFSVDGPLRSLRVLFSTEHWLAVQTSDVEVVWAWLYAPGPRIVGNAIALMDMEFIATSDAEAIQRAIDAAVQWIGAKGQ